MLNDEYNHESWNDRAHNIYFDTGVSGGYPAIILYALFIASIIYALYRAYRTQTLSQIETGLLFGLIIAYVFQNLFAFDSNISVLVLFVIAGILYSLHGLDNKNKKEKHVDIKIKPETRTLLGALFLVLGGVSLIYTSILPAQKTLLFNTVFSRMPIQERIAHYNDLLSGPSIGNDYDVSRFAEIVYKAYASDPLKIKSDMATLEYRKKDLLALVQYLEEISKVNEHDFRLKIKIVHLYSTYIFLTDMKFDQVLSDHIVSILDQARVLSPTNPEVYWGMAQLSAWQGDLQGIIKAYRQGIEIGPKVKSSHKLLIDFARAIGDQKLYNESLQQAQKDIPGFTLD
jgi:hypothetical protein